MSRGRIGPARSVGNRIFDLLLRLLPADVRGRAGAGMREMFEARQVEAVSPLALLRCWLHEFGGLLRVAVASRRRDEWLERADVLLAVGVSSGSPVRAVRGGSRMIDGLMQDLRFAVRSAARRRGAWTLAVLTCALGVGTSTAMFSVVDSVLWRPLPYPDPGRLVMVYPTIPEWRTHPTLSGSWMRGAWSYPEYADWVPQQTAFAQAAIYGRSSGVIDGEGEPRVISIGRSSPGLFAMLGARPVIGRLFSEDAPGEPGESVVLTFGLWQSQFGGASDVVGSELRIDGRPRTIVGVLPERFILTDLAADVWVPIGNIEMTNRDDHNLAMIGRLADGVPMESARSETDRILTRSSEGHYLQHGAFLISMLEDGTRRVRTPLTILMVASLLLLLVACVNVAALVLGMGIDRDQEILVRGAIGAGRRRLVRQLLTESLLLALLGGAAGLLLAVGLTRGVLLLAPVGIPRLAQAAVSVRALVFTSAVSAIVGIGFGLLPALALTSSDVAGRLRSSRVLAGRGRLHAVLVVAQLALACILLVGAGLLTHTLISLDRVDPGFDPDGILAVRVAPPFRSFRVDGAFEPALYSAYFDRISEEVAGVPGVTAVAVTDVLPFSGDRGSNYVRPADRPLQPDDSVISERTFVSANYMDVVRMRRLAGRLFDESDDHPGAAPVVIINERLARRFWPGESAVGKPFGYWDQTATVVGVVENTRDRSLDIDRDYRFFVPRAEAGHGGSLIIRVAAPLDPAAIVAAVRDRIWSVDASVPITSTITLRRRMHDSLAEQRFRARLMIAFAVFATLFAALGIYGVTSRSVGARTREIGIRMALGERPQGIVALVLAQGLRLTAIGSLVGILGGIAASRTLATVLYQTRTFEPVTLVIVAGGLAFLALAASLAPSLRAARVDPMVALRVE